MDHQQAQSPWRKSGYSTNNESCAEVRRCANGAVDIRHSRHPDGEIIHFTHDEWIAFARSMAAGEFDDMGELGMADPGTWDLLGGPDPDPAPPGQRSMLWEWMIRKVDRALRRVYGGQ